jgi:ubiquinone/menaquinone biosynthesis C-methylase UbiE
MSEKIPEHVGDTFNFEKSAAYYKYRPGYPEEFYREISTRLEGLKNSRVIDLGCGDGRFALQLALLGPEIFTVDISESMLKILHNTLKNQKIQKIYPIRSDAIKLPFPSHSIDYVFIGQSFHWMKRELVLKELARVLRENGLGVIFWTQPVTPLPLSVRISDALISQYVSHYCPDSAHNLSLKSTIPHHFKFNIQSWKLEFTYNYKVEDYVNAVISKSFVANSLNHENTMQFKMKLSEMLKQNGCFPLVEEKYLLTVLFAKPGYE